MKNRESLYPGRVKLTPVDAANGIYDLVRADEPQEEGTPLNKKLLDFAVAACGVTAGTATAYTLNDEFGGFELVNGAKVNFQLHVASGVNPTLNVNGTGAKALKTALGDAMPSAIPAGSWVTAFYSAALGVYVIAGGNVSAAQIVAWNAKPTTDEVIAEIVARAAKTATGTYTGSNTYGSSNKRSLSFDFTPHLVVVVQSSTNTATYSRFPLIMVNPSTRGYSMNNSDEGYSLTVAWGTKNVSWYSSSSAADQLNANGYKYAYVAVGL